jgi:hypothetical protein
MKGGDQWNQEEKGTQNERKENQKTKHEKREEKRETSQTTSKDHDLFEEQSGLLKHSPT